MGVKNIARRIGEKTGDKVAQLSKLSPGQIIDVQLKREAYLLEMPNPDDEVARSLTEKMMAACGIEIFNAFLPQIKELYLPMIEEAEYDEKFDTDFNIRYFNITKWVTDKKENNLEKLVNVYAVLSNDDCNIALVFNRTKKGTDVYLAVINLKNADNKVDADIYIGRLKDAIRGNFPGAELKNDGMGILPCLDNDKSYSVAIASNIPAEKSEKFISQTIEKLLDGIVPSTIDEEYTIVLLATPILDIEDRKLRLSEFYSGLKPYEQWQQDFHYTDSVAHGSSATVGINVGASAGVQNGQSNGQVITDGITNQSSKTDSINENSAEADGISQAESESQSNSISISNTTTTSVGASDSVGVNANVNVGGEATLVKGNIGGNYQHGWNQSTSETLGKTATDTLTKGLTNTISKTVTKTTGISVANTLGKAVTNSLAKTSSTIQNSNLGVNFGTNFARSSTVTASIGKNEGITQTFTNYNIKHALELLEIQMKRLEQSSALGMWDFATYVLSENQNVANNVAHSYLSLTLGEDSYMSKSAVNLWRGNVFEEKASAKEICNYIRKLRHPIFALNPYKCIEDSKELKNIVSKDQNSIQEIDLSIMGNESFLAYPPIVTATTPLSGKELAYSLNFPQKAIAGLPILECAEFGRNVITYNGEIHATQMLKLGNIFHMNHKEKSEVFLDKQSLASHVFITGCTGSGKSNTVYQILNELKNSNTKFLVIEPAKGEYKNIFGTDENIFVYGTNPEYTPLLKINPFSFPKEIHVLEHIDRLIEIFNVCWPMYAAMPAVLKKAVEKAYVDCGWNLKSSKNKYDEVLFPNFIDVMSNIKIIIDSSEYDNENKGAYKGALLTRIESLTNGFNGMIFNQNEINTTKLFDENVIVDLSRISSLETKSLIMGMLVLKLQEYRISNTNAINSEIKHITILEEAHNLLKRTSTEQTNESANLLGKSVEMIANAIAEMRTYGEGFIIVDQAPGLLDMSTIRNTNTKIIMRLPDYSDRELVGKSANLDDEQIKELSKLPCGVAAIYQNEWIQPVLCKVDKYKFTNKIYTYTLNDPSFYIEEPERKIITSLIDCIVNNEILKKNNTIEINKLKDVVIKANLQSPIKCKLIEYINADKSNKFSCSCSLIYSLFDMEQIIYKAIQNNNIEEAVEYIIESIRPLIEKYSKEVQNSILAQLMYEQVERNYHFKDFFCQFVDLFKSGGGLM